MLIRTLFLAGIVTLATAVPVAKSKSPLQAKSPYSFSNQPEAHPAERD
jgi:hypothetical protein